MNGDFDKQFKRTTRITFFVALFQILVILTVIIVGILVLIHYRIL